VALIVTGRSPPRLKSKPVLPAIAEKDRLGRCHSANSGSARLTRSPSLETFLSSYSSPGSSKGSGRTSAALATVNIEATAAIPSVTVPTAIAVNAGVRPRARML